MSVPDIFLHRGFCVFAWYLRVSERSSLSSYISFFSLGKVSGVDSRFSFEGGSSMFAMVALFFGS
jgi:hypothetical protein